MKKKQPLPPLDRAERIELFISYSLKAIMLFTIVMSFVEFNLFLMATSLLILLFSALPGMIQHTFRITLPVEVDLVLTTFIFAHFIFGEAGNYYNRFWFFDLILHSSSGILIGMAGFVIMYFFLYSSRVSANPLLVSVFCVTFSLALGALWEIFEFCMDQLFGFTMQKSGNTDTMSDLIVDFLGACVVGFWVYRYLTKDEDGLVKLMINRFIRYNLRLKDRHFRRRKSKDSVQGAARAPVQTPE